MIHPARQFVGRSLSRPTDSERDRVNELYDRACDLLEAAQAMRRAASEQGTAAGIAATLGCLEASARSLSDTARSLGDEAGGAVTVGDGTHGPETAREALARDFAMLAGSLDGVGQRCALVRQHTVAALSELPRHD